MGLRDTRSIRRVICCASLLIFSTSSHATNGYFAHGFGIKNRAMAGAGTAHPLDATSAAVNPAGMVHVGDRLDLSIEVFSPRRHFTVTGDPSFEPGDSLAPPLVFPLAPGKYRSGKEYFTVPTLGWNRMLDEHSSIGIAIYGQGGMNTSYRDPVFGAGSAGVDLSQLFVAPTHARRIGDRFSIGISPILAVQRFEAKGIGSFAPLSADPANLSDRGHDTAFGGGVRLGVQAALTPELTAGAAWKSRIHMERFEDYSGLFAGKGGFDVPASFNLGLAWQPEARVLLALDVEHIAYGSIDSVGSPMLPNLGTAPLGDADGAGFGWKDMTVVKLGGAWQLRTLWRVRGGVSFGNQPIRKSEVLFNILAPGVQQWHFTAGVTRSVGARGELDLGLMYSPAESVRGVNPLNTSQTISLEMHQFSAQIGYTFRL
jgi:long-chain fatty acid transport protein